MTAAFVDASALVKRYVPEPGGAAVAELQALVVSGLSRAEVVSAVRRKARAGELGLAEANTVCLRVGADFDDPTGGWAGLSPVPVSDDVLRDAAGLLARHALTAGDAVQLASAIRGRDADPAIVSFACFDGRLRRAASVEGFDLVPPHATGD